MINRFTIAAAAFCALLCANSAVNAAKVSNQGGAVLVSRGSGFVATSADVELAPGGRVLVQPGGMATITYAGNCTVRVGSGFWQIQQAPPCADGATEIDFTGRMNQEAAPTEPPGVDPLVVGGVVLAGAVAIGVLVGQKADDDRPASP